MSTSDEIGGRAEDGFTLIEMVVAVMIVGIVMMALAAGFVSSVATSSNQSNAQTATQLAGDAVDRARSLKNTSLFTGRDKTSSDAQWAAPLPSVAPYLSTMVESWDSSAATGSGATAALPTTARTVTINNTAFGQYFYLGKCWQSLTGGNCGSTQLAVPFVQLVVAVTWPGESCPSGVCAYTSATLISPTSDPTFDSNATATPPAVSDPGTQTSGVGVADTLTVVASGGAAPLIWTGTGLPPGLTINSAGVIAGIPTTAGTYTVTVTATDAFSLAGSATFTWKVYAPPVLTDPGAQAATVGTAVNLVPTVTGGAAPLTYTATPAATSSAVGLPTGLSLNATTGVISGTPSAVAAPRTVTLTVTDAFGRTSSVTDTWRVDTALVLATPAAQTSTLNVPDTLSVTATGGATPYTYSASGLPPGLSISALTGLISGTPTTAGTFANAMVTVVDAAARTLSTAKFSWTVFTPVVITYPATGAIFNIGKKSNGTYFTALASGGSGGYTWSATGLPTDVGITTAGAVYRIGNKASVPIGTYICTLTVTAGSGTSASVTITIVVT